MRLALLKNGCFDLNTIRYIAYHSNTSIDFAPEGTCIVVIGRARGIVRARRFLTVSRAVRRRSSGAARRLQGLLPVSLQFEHGARQPIEKAMLRALEAELNVQINEKLKANSSSPLVETTIVIRTCEANLAAAYCARQRILGEEAGETADESIIVNDYEFMIGCLECVASLARLQSVSRRRFAGCSSISRSPPAAASPLHQLQASSRAPNSRRRRSRQSARHVHFGRRF